MTTKENSTIAVIGGTALTTLLVSSGALWLHKYRRGNDVGTSTLKSKQIESQADDDTVATDSSNNSSSACSNTPSLLHCIRNRRSVFPRQFLPNPPPLDPAVIESLLEAALWGPFHGKCHKGCIHPAKLVVLGKESMVEMQELTLQYYDANWEKIGWGSGTRGTAKEYAAWRQMTKEEITGRWSPCTHMIAIGVRRQSGPKRFPEWEEMAAAAAAVQNMHLQSTQFPELACYWSSWHDAARDSKEMKNFLGLQEEDMCMGFFIVAQVKRQFRDRRKRDESLLEVEWRS